MRCSTSHRPTPTPSGISPSLSSRLHPYTTFRCRLPPLLIFKCTPLMPPTIVVRQRLSGATRHFHRRHQSSSSSRPPHPALPSVATSYTLLPVLIVECPLILTGSSHLTRPLFCLHTSRSPHIVRVTQFTIKSCVGWCVVLTNPILRPNRAQVPSPMVCG